MGFKSEARVGFRAGVQTVYLGDSYIKVEKIRSKLDYINAELSGGGGGRKKVNIYVYIPRLVFCNGLIFFSGNNAGTGWNWAGAQLGTGSSDEYKLLTASDDVFP